MQQGYRDHRGHVKPDGDVDVTFAPDQQGAEKIDCKNDPNKSDGDVNRPFQLGIFLGDSDSQRQRHRCCDDDQLPAPEVDVAQGVTEHPGLAEPLHRMVDAGKHAVADKGENHRVRVERSEPAKGKPGAKVGLPKYQLGRDDHPKQ